MKPFESIEIDEDPISPYYTCAFVDAVLESNVVEEAYLIWEQFKAGKKANAEHASFGAESFMQVWLLGRILDVYYDRYDLSDIRRISTLRDAIASSVHVYLNKMPPF